MSKRIKSSRFKLDINQQPNDINLSSKIDKINPIVDLSQSKKSSSSKTKTSKSKRVREASSRSNSKSSSSGSSSSEGSEKVYDVPDMSFNCFCLVSLEDLSTPTDKIKGKGKADISIDLENVLPTTTLLKGERISSLYHFSKRSCFVFPSIEVLKVGNFRLKFKLFELLKDYTRFISHVYSNSFEVYNEPAVADDSSQASSSQARIPFLPPSVRTQIRRGSQSSSDNNSQFQPLIAPSFDSNLPSIPIPFKPLIPPSDFLPVPSYFSTETSNIRHQTTPVELQYESTPFSPQMNSPIASTSNYNQPTTHASQFPYQPTVPPPLTQLGPTPYLPPLSNKIDPSRILSRNPLIYSSGDQRLTNTTPWNPSNDIRVSNNNIPSYRSTSLSSVSSSDSNDQIQPSRLPIPRQPFYQPVDYLMQSDEIEYLKENEQIGVSSGDNSSSSRMEGSSESGNSGNNIERSGGSSKRIKLAESSSRDPFKDDEPVLEGEREDGSRSSGSGSGSGKGDLSFLLTESVDNLIMEDGNDLFIDSNDSSFGT